MRTSINKITKEANLEPEVMNEFLFADDQSLAEEEEEKLQEPRLVGDWKMRFRMIQAVGDSSHYCKPTEERHDNEGSH